MPNLNLVHFKAYQMDSNFRKVLFATARQNKGMHTLIVEMITACVCSYEGDDWVSLVVDEINRGFGTNAQLMEVNSIQPMFFWGGEEWKTLSWKQEKDEFHAHPKGAAHISCEAGIDKRKSSKFSYDCEGGRWREGHPNIQYTWLDLPRIGPVMNIVDRSDDEL